jgi:NADPH:quinone reductase-like Zn-dependent oxidoreductase
MLRTRGAVVKAVQFDQYGGVDVLDVVEVPQPEPGPGEVPVAVKARFRGGGMQ